MKPELKIKFYGTRGSIPISDPAFQEFGGNTTCISMVGNMTNRIAILDAGTGIRTLGKEISSPDYPMHFKDISILFSHFHWDHIQGFPFFDPAFDSNTRIVISAMGKNWPIKDVREIFDVAMQSEYFPVGLDDMEANLDFVMPGKDIGIYEDTKVTALKHNHPGGAYSFRIEWKGKVLVICTDIEHEGGLNQDIIKLAKGADLLIHDGQYTSEELRHKKGWGHSSFDQAMDVAEQAECKQLVITHHDPDHNDEFLKREEEICIKRFPNSHLAREGMEIVI